MILNNLELKNIAISEGSSNVDYTRKSKKNNEVGEENAQTAERKQFSDAVIISVDNNIENSGSNIYETLSMQMLLMDLKSTDLKVKLHEKSHQNAGGIYVSAPTYEYEIGPDGRQYAVSGSVNIDISKIANNPRATISKMDIVRRAALAPVDPSAEDIAVAMKASMIKTEAKQELAQQTGNTLNVIASYEFAAKTETEQETKYYIA